MPQLLLLLRRQLADCLLDFREFGHARTLPCACRLPSEKFTLRPGRIQFYRRQQR